MGVDYSDEAAEIWQEDYQLASTFSSTVELTSSKELLEEGQALQHCVGGYGPYCAAGYSSIFSLRYNNARQVTIEINPRNKNIVQARGVSNRRLSSSEQQIINLWFNKIVINDNDLIDDDSDVLDQ